MSRDNEPKFKSIAKKMIEASRKKTITDFLVEMGYGATTVQLALDHIKENLVPPSAIPLSAEAIAIGEKCILSAMAKNIKALSTDEIDIVTDLSRMMRIKSLDHSCESVMKLLLHIGEHSQKLESLANTQDILRTAIPPEEGKVANVEKIFGYVLSLNFNRRSYFQFLTSGLSGLNDVEDRVTKHASAYKTLMDIDIASASDPDASLKRREILMATELLLGHLQRDPEEAAKYNAQMAHAKSDKERLLIDVGTGKQVVVDIGPAGGATFMSTMGLGDKLTKYFGIEFDGNELKSLNHMLSTYMHDEQTAEQRLGLARFVEGNALDLANVMKKLKTEFPLEPDEKLAIVLSSVIHEIYSYCPYQNSEPSVVSDLMTTTSAASTYNVNTVEKIYREALLAIKENPNGGSLNIRDGVMYSNPNEPVTFVFKNESWVKMFEKFLEDKKYAHLVAQLPSTDVEVDQPITLPAKYVQEFMIKANWGPESFGNEINEVYCYLTLENHTLLIEKVAKELGMTIDLETTEYTQQGYKDHITNDKIVIQEGFGMDKFPPTNMVIRMVSSPVMKPELVDQVVAGVVAPAANSAQTSIKSTQDIKSQLQEKRGPAASQESNKKPGFGMD